MIEGHTCTVEYRKKHHLVLSNKKKRFTLMCGANIPEGKRSMRRASMVLPTCDKCLSYAMHRLDRLRDERDDANKYAEKSYKRTSVLSSAFLTTVSAQRAITHMEDSAEYKEGSYPFIPIGEGIIDTFIFLKRILPEDKRWSGYGRENIRFLDAGCGIGNVLVLAEATGLGNKYTGLEYFPDMIASAEKFLGIGIKYEPHRSFEIENADILKYERYSEFDIIYYYCPFETQYLQIMFEERLEDMMSVGAVLVARLKQSHVIEKDVRFERIVGIEQSYIKVKDGKRRKSALKDKKYVSYNPERDEIIRKKYADSNLPILKRKK